LLIGWGSSFKADSLFGPCSKTALYQCDEMTVFMKSCCEKMESMEPNLMASTFLAFLQR